MKIRTIYLICICMFLLVIGSNSIDSLTEIRGTKVIIDNSSNILVNFTGEIGQGDLITIVNSTTGNIKTYVVNMTTINQTILDLTQSTTYLPYVVIIENGTILEGNITSLWGLSDGNTLNISESTGVDAMRYTVNFTNVTKFQQVIRRVKYQQGSTHLINLGLWNFCNLVFDTDLDTITQTDKFTSLQIPVLDSICHIDPISGEVMVLFNHENSGNPTHMFTNDYLVLVDGASLTSATEHDGLSGVNPDEHRKHSDIYMLTSGGCLDFGATNSIADNVTGIFKISSCTVSSENLTVSDSFAVNDASSGGNTWQFPLGKLVDLVNETLGSGDGGGTPGGVDTQVQFNDGGVFGGDSGLLYVKGTDILTIGNILYVNEVSNSFMTQGVSINQGANDNMVFAMASSDVVHGVTSFADTNTFGGWQKTQGTSGGLTAFGFKDSDGNAGGAFVNFGILAENADTTKSTSARGIVELSAGIKSGTGVGNVNTDGNLVVIRNRGTTARFIFDAEGTGHADVAWVTYSDERLKDNIQPIPYGLYEITQLNPISYQRISKNEGENDIYLKQMIGFSAQEVEKIIPEVVIPPNNNESYYSLNYDSLIPVLVKAIQEQQEEINKLKKIVGGN